MSGNTIGGVIGGAIGFVVSGFNPAGAQWGWMIGSVVGGIVDPQVIQGAQWQNQQLQGSSDGLARAIVFGTSTVTGNLLDAEPGGPRIGKKKEGGKGGPKVERDTAILTYAIEICDSSELRGTSVSGVIAVWEDEKIVYDLRPDQNGVISGERSASSQKWLANKKFYFGGEDQSPPAELASIHGSGNVPAYRGSCIMTVLDEDLMVDIDDKPRGRIPTYRFLVSACAPVLPPTGDPLPHYILACGSPVGGSGNPMWASALAQDDLEFAGLEQSIGADIPSAIPTWYNGTWAAVGANDSRYSIDDRTSFQAGTISTPGGTPRDIVGGPAGFLVHCNSLYPIRAAGSPPAEYTELTSGEYADGNAWPSGLESSFHSFQAGNAYFVAYNRALWKADEPRGPFTLICDATTLEGDPNGDMLQNWWSICDGAAGRLWAVCDQYFSLQNRQVRYSDDDGVHWYNADIVVDIPNGSDYHPIQIAYTGTQYEVGYVVATANNNAIWTDANSWAAPIDIGITVGGSHHICCTGGKAYIFSTTQCVVFDPETMEVSAPVTLPIQNISGVAASTGYTVYGGGIAIPDSPGYYVDGDGNVIGPDMPIASLCGAPLDYVVRALHKIGAPQLVDAEFDLTALAGELVRGYTIQDADVTVATACDPLRKVWSFDLPSYDGQIHAIKRGRAADWSLSEDDLVTMDTGYEESLQDESLAFPLKLHIGYTDPVIDYKETTQISERYSADARVAGEEKVSLGQLVLTATEAKRAVVKAHKQAWANIEDTRKLAAPLEYIEAVNSDTFAFRGKRYRADSMRVEGLQVVIESAAYDRIGSYQSSAIGVEGTPGPSGPNFVRGPTISVLMNMPVLRDEDDKAGVYVAAAGLVSGWKGTVIQASRDGVTFENGPQITTSATMGELTAELPSASRYAQDWANTLAVTLYPLSGELDSVTHEAIIEEANAAAIVYPSGKVEIIQFQSATEIAPRQYELTGLMRGRQDTTPGTHAVGAKFVLLNDAIRFVAIKPEDLGKTLTFRCPALGTAPDANAMQTITFDTIESLREWQPYHVAVTDDGSGGYCVEWIGRARLGSSLLPVHSQWFAGYRVTFTVNGQTHEVDTTEQSLCMSAAAMTAAFGVYGWPDVSVRAISRIVTGDDDFSSPPSPPPITTSPPAVAPDGSQASTTLGPNGGYADDSPHPVPQPTVYSTDLIPDGTLSGWKDVSGAPLSTWWKIEGGGIVYEGHGYSTAFYEPARLRMSQYPMPRWEVTVTADVQTDLGQTAALGVAWGTTTSLPYSDTSTPQEYPVETTVTHTYIRAPERAGLQGLNGEAIPQIAPLLVVNGSSPARASFRNVTMTIEEVPAAVTTATIANLDFASGLTGWTQWPPPGAGTPTITTVTGGVKATGISAYALFAFLINDDPITLVDEVGKALRMRGEFWSNDPTVWAGRTVRGASLQLAVKPTGGDYIVLPWQSSSLYRGDWTLREIWQIAEVANAGGFTIHLAIRMQQSVGYGSGVRNITVAVTDDPV